MAEIGHIYAKRNGHLIRLRWDGKGWVPDEPIPAPKAKPFRPMLAKTYAGNVAFPVIAQPKLDGVRCIARKDGLFSRDGNPITTQPHIEAALAPLFAAEPDLVLDGELWLPGTGLADIAKAARYGVSPVSVGNVVQLVTSGVKLSEYRPAGVDDAVDIRLRLPAERRTLSTLDQLRVQTNQGPVPISNFVTREAERSSGILNRIDGRRTITVTANVASGYQVAAVQSEVISALQDMKDELGATTWKLAGSSEESDAAASFLTNAFGAAIFLIFVVLLAQFNRFTSVWLVLMTVVMSTIGVFLGLLVSGQTFGIVMSGIGVIALAGVVVNNNIVLIDTYDRLREEGMNKYDAIIQTCRERARPVLLTAISAVLGVLPIAFGLGLELFDHEVTIGAPSTQWWISLSSAIVYGLSFATVLTLIVTPSALMVFTREKRPARGSRWRFFTRLFRRRRGEDEMGDKTGGIEVFPKAAE